MSNFVHLCSLGKETIFNKQIIFNAYNILLDTTMINWFSNDWMLRILFIIYYYKQHYEQHYQSVSSVAQSCPILCDPQHARLPCPSPTLRVHPNSCPLSQWCHPTISSSIIPFSSLLQSFPVLGTFQMSQLFASGGQSIGVSTSTSVLPMNSHDWFPLGWTGWISLQSKGLSRVFSNTTVQKHQFFSVQLSLWSNSHIHTWLLEKP